MDFGAKMYILNEAHEALRRIKKAENDHEKIEIILYAITKTMTTSGHIPIYSEAARELCENTEQKLFKGVHEI